MKNKWLIFFAAISIPIPAQACNPAMQNCPDHPIIALEHRICAKSADCVMIDTKCSCLQDNSLAAINSKYTDIYASLALCSKAQTRICAEEGARAIRPGFNPAPACIDGFCTIVNGAHLPGCANDIDRDCPPMMQSAPKIPD